jgi:hypothetical protein
MSACAYLKVKFQRQYWVVFGQSALERQAEETDGPVMRPRGLGCRLGKTARLCLDKVRSFAAPRRDQIGGRSKVRTSLTDQRFGNARKSFIRTWHCAMPDFLPKQMFHPTTCRGVWRGQPLWEFRGLIPT